MRKRFFAAAVTLLLLLTGCTAKSHEYALPAHEQTADQLYLPSAKDKQMHATWIPYFIAERLLISGDETAAQQAASDYFQRLKGIGIDTVFIHICAFGESWYPSAYYPQADETHGLDALRIFLDEAHDLGLSFHAWLNPLRLQTPEQMTAHTGDALLTAWYKDPALREERFALWDGRYYFNPAADSTAAFLADAVTELVTRYHPDGVHIDDYFYPSPALTADAALFAASGADDLGTWRRERISALVKGMCTAVHASDENAMFSISPQGNPAINPETLYADVERWLAEDGYCDLLMPQVYFGYRNALCPFTETITKWLAMPRSPSVQIGIGLAAYKVGEDDPYAGSGRDEWQTDPAVLQKQTAQLAAMPQIACIALYHSDAALACGGELSGLVSLDGSGGTG